MEKSHLDLLKEELALIEQGKIQYEPDPDEIVIHDRKEFERKLADLDRINGKVKPRSAKGKRVEQSKMKKLARSKINGRALSGAKR